MTTENSFDISSAGAEYFRLFLQPVFQDADFKALFTFLPTKLNKVQMSFMGELQNIIQSGMKCGFTPKGDVAITDRCVELQPLKVNVEQCVDEFRNSIFMYFAREDVDVTNLNGTIVSAAIIDRVRNGIKKDLEKMAFFGNPASVDAMLKLAEGIWSVHIPNLISDPSSGIRSVDAGTGALAAGDGIAIVRNVYFNASPELRGLPANRRVILVSRAVYDQFLIDREDRTVGSTIAITQLDGGELQVRYHGILVLPMFFWDENADLFPVVMRPAGTDPLRAALYTTRENMVYAGDMGGASSLRNWYDENDEVVRFKSRFQVGFNYVHPVFFSIAGQGLPVIS